MPGNQWDQFYQIFIRTIIYLLNLAQHSSFRCKERTVRDLSLHFSDPASSLTLSGVINVEKLTLQFLACLESSHGVTEFDNDFAARQTV